MNFIRSSLRAWSGEPRGLLIALLVLTMVWGGVSPYPVRLRARIILILILICGGGLSILLLKRSRCLPRPVLIVVVVFSIGAILTTAFSESPRVSMEWWLLMVIPLALFVFWSLVPGESRLVVVFVVTASLSLIVLGLFTLKFVEWYRLIGLVDGSSSLAERLPVTLIRTGLPGVHPNLVGLMTALGLVAGTVLIHRGRRTGWFLAGMVVLAAALMVTGTRIAWGAALVGVFVASVILSGRWRHGVVLLAGLGVFLVVGLVIVKLTGYQPEFIFRDTFTDRLPVMTAAWEMFLDHPWVGGGPGSFLWSVDAYLGSTYPGVGQRVVWVHAHNGYLHAMAEMGLVGFVAIGVCAIVLVRSAFQRLGSPEFRFESAAVLASLTSFGFFSLTEVVVPGISPLIFLVPLLALSGGELPAADDVDTPKAATRRTWPWAIALGLTIILPLIFLVGTAPAQWFYEKSIRTATEGDTGAMQDAISLAGRLDSLVAYARVEEVYRPPPPSASSWRRLARRPPSDAASEVNYLATSLETDPNGVHLALESYQSVLPYEEVTQLELARVAAFAGDEKTAVMAGMHVLAMNPWMLRSPYWTELLPTELVADSIDLVIDLKPCVVGSSFMLQGLIDERLSELVRDRCDADHPARLTSQILEGDGLLAIKRLTGLIRSTPDDAEYRRLIGLALLQENRMSDARRHWAIASQLGDPWSALQLARTYRAAPKEVSDQLTQNWVGYSPVIGSRKVPAYRYGLARFQGLYRRLYPPVVLTGESWKLARTALHMNIIEELS